MIKYFLLLMILLFSLPVQAEMRWVRDKDGNITNVRFDEGSSQGVKIQDDGDTKNQQESIAAQESVEGQDRPQPHKRVWRWVDSRGNVHFSDKKMSSLAQEVKHDQNRLNRVGNSQARAISKTHRIPFRKMGDSMVVLGEVNGILTHFMIDTGASLVVVTPDAARRAGLDADTANKIRLQTANGEIHAPKANLEQLQIAQLAQQNVAAVVQDTGFPDIGLLGMSFLKAYKMTIDHLNGELILEQK